MFPDRSGIGRTSLNGAQYLRLIHDHDTGRFRSVVCEYLMGTSPFAMRNDLVGQPPSSQIEVYWGHGG